MGRTTKRIAVGAGIAAAAAGMIAAGLVYWSRRDRPSPPQARGPAATVPTEADRPAEAEPTVTTFRRVPRDRTLSESTFVGTDGRMYSRYDTDGDGLYDADEIRQYGTLMYDARTRASARSIEYAVYPSPDDTDADGLPDEWERGYFGTLETTPDDDPDQDGFPNRIEFANAQSPIAVDLVEIAPTGSTARVLVTTGGGFSTCDPQFRRKQAQAARRVARGEAGGCAAVPGYRWKPRPVALGRQLRRTCPAVHPWARLINRSLRSQEDADDDGLPDEWETEVFGGLDRGRHDDPDADGFPNIVELCRGTDPNRIDILPPSLRPDRLMHVERSDDPWDIGWDIRSIEFWRVQERRAAGATDTRSTP